MTTGKQRDKFVRFVYISQPHTKSKTEPKLTTNQQLTLKNMNKTAKNCSKFLGVLLTLCSLDIASNHEMQADDLTNNRSNRYKKKELINNTPTNDL